MTSVHSCTWELVPLLMREEILAKKEKMCSTEKGDKSISKIIIIIEYNTMNNCADECLGIIHKIKSVICAERS